MTPHLTPEPDVELVRWSRDPTDTVVAAARTCYSSKVVTPEDVAADPASRDRVFDSIYAAGHHTTLQHPTFTFALRRVSRQFVWSFLHSHQFYNCVAGETEIPHFHGGDKEPWTVAEIYERLRSRRTRAYVEKMHVRSVDEAGNLVPNTILAVVATGRKPVIKVTTALGYTVRATAKHRFMRFDRSWARLFELRVGDLIVVNGIRVYKDPSWLKQKYRDESLSLREMAAIARTTPHTIRKWLRRHKLQKPMGSWSIGKPPPNKGRTKADYEPLRRTSAWARRTGHRPPRNGRASENSNWKGPSVKNPRDRARLWFKADRCEVCGATRSERRIERHHRNKDIYDNSAENIRILCSLCHKAAESPHHTIQRVQVDRIVSIEPDGEAETYDVVMQDPHHNFVANGFVVHNSEQVSQRYVEVKPRNFMTPPLEGPALEVYRRCIEDQMKGYHALIDMLTPAVADDYYRTFPARRGKPEKHEGAVHKRVIEIARYVLPVATQTHLYHTVSGVTLHRYKRLCDQYDTPLETRAVVDRMVDAVRAIDPDFFRTSEDPLPLERTSEFEAFTALHSPARSRAFLDEFDGELGPLRSKLVDFKAGAERVMADGVRAVLGVPRADLADADAIGLVMDPAKNAALAGALVVTTLSKLSRAMSHPHFTFKKKLSHTADSQNQRHRMTPGTRPILAGHVLADRVDVVLPDAIERHGAARDAFSSLMERTWASLRRLLDLGVPEEFAHYVLPNALAIRFVESGDLLHLHHKWTTRACLLAQEEIWRCTLEEILQVREKFPLLGRHLAAPCGLRKEADLRPYCPEGPRFCGVRVWEQDVKDYARTL